MLPTAPVSDPVDYEPHPWNTGFGWADHDGPAASLAPAQLAAFDREGFFVLPGLVPPALLARLLAEVDAAEAAKDEQLRAAQDMREDISESGAIVFTGSLVQRSTALREVIGLPAITGLLGDLLGPDVVLYWDQAVYKKPSKPRRFPFHQDNGYVFADPQAYVTLWLAMSEATVANGCPQLVPGLHRLGTLRHYPVEPLGQECFPDHPDAVAAELQPGDAVVFSSLTPHQTGPNTTDEVRKGYVLQFAAVGTHMLRGDPESGGPSHRSACDQPRHVVVLRDGRPPRA